MYLQSQGIPMGFASSPILANIYLFYCLDTPLCQLAAVVFYKRFLDDIFAIT